MKNDAIQRVCLYLANALISFLAMFRECHVALWLLAKPHVYSAMTGFSKRTSEDDLANDGKWIVVGHLHPSRKI